VWDEPAVAVARTLTISSCSGEPRSPGAGAGAVGSGLKRR
jgi:hypothetical protein